MIFGAARMARYAARSGGRRRGPRPPWPVGVRVVVITLIAGMIAAKWPVPTAITAGIAVLALLAAAAAGRRTPPRRDTLDDVVARWEQEDAPGKGAQR